MKKFNNTYDEYKNILNIVRNTKKLCTFEEACKKDKFILLRHDIEFSVEKAYQMAQIEYNAGVRSAYFIQIENDSYNAFSDVNTRLIREIHDMSHEIGLHYRQGGDNNARIKQQIYMMECMYGFKINSFSTHRPKENTSYEKYNIDGIINAYSEEYFTRTDDMSRVKVKYISDSKYQWNYGYPSREELLSYDKVQLLVHPFQWAEKPLGMMKCFDKLLADNSEKVKATYIREFKKLQEVADGSKKMDL